MLGLLLLVAALSAMPVSAETEAAFYVATDGDDA